MGNEWKQTKKINRNLTERLRILNIRNKGKREGHTVDA